MRVLILLIFLNNKIILFDFYKIVCYAEIMIAVKEMVKLYKYTGDKENLFILREKEEINLCSIAAIF